MEREREREGEAVVSEMCFSYWMEFAVGTLGSLSGLKGKRGSAKALFTGKKPCGRVAGKQPPYSRDDSHRYMKKSILHCLLDPPTQMVCASLRMRF